MNLLNKYLCEGYEGKKVKITGDVIGKGKTGTVVEEASKGILLVKIGKQKALYFIDDLEIK